MHGRWAPVPAAFFREWEQWQPDFAEAIKIQPERVFDYELHKVVPKVAFDVSHFTRRELRLMQQLAQRFHDDSPGPWPTSRMMRRAPGPRSGALEVASIGTCRTRWRFAMTTRTPTQFASTPTSRPRRVHCLA